MDWINVDDRLPDESEGDVLVSVFKHRKHLFYDIGSYQHEEELIVTTDTKTYKFRKGWYLGSYHDGLLEYGTNPDYCYVAFWAKLEKPEY